MAHGRSKCSLSHAAICFIVLTLVNKNKYVVPTQIVFDTVVVSELDMFDIYTMLERSHLGGEFLEHAIDTFLKSILLLHEPIYEKQQ